METFQQAKSILGRWSMGLKVGVGGVCWCVLCGVATYDGGGGLASQL